MSWGDIRGSLRPGEEGVAQSCARAQVTFWANVLGQGLEDSPGG